MDKIKVQEDIVYNKYADGDIKIIHISDIHFNINTTRKKLDLISEKIIHEKANYLMVTGDTIDRAEIIDNEDKIKELIAFFKKIAKYIRIIISIGNHDTFKNCNAFFKKLDDIDNIYVLDNLSYVDEYLYVAGFTLPNIYYYNDTGDESTECLCDTLDKNKKLWNNLPNDKIKIALIHSPTKLTEENVLNRLSGYDLILSGHTHDGVVPEFLKIFFGKNRGIISPLKKFFPKIARGKIVKEFNNKKIVIIISGGVTKLSPMNIKLLNILNAIYYIGVNRIIIKRKEV